MGFHVEIKESAIKMVESAGFLDSLAVVIKQNGELFGAHRDVGQGGFAERVMEAMTGSFRFVRNESEAQVRTTQEQTFQARRPVVACSGGSLYSAQLAKGETLPPEAKSWYLNAHCYTVTAYDGQSQTVTLRNPWAKYPAPDGVFALPVRTFVPAFRGIITTQ